MGRNTWRAVSLALAIAMVTLPAATAAPQSRVRHFGRVAARGRGGPAYGALPLAFEVNRGQTDPRVRFLAHGAGDILFMTADGPVVTTQPSWDPVPRDVLASRRAPRRRPTVQMALRLTFVGSGKAQISGQDRLPGAVNYLIGRDPRHWHTGITTYARVVYRNVYPAVDLAYYGTRGRLEYDIIARPGARLNGVRLRVGGARGLSIDQRGNLRMGGAEGIIVQDRPLIYQEVGGRRRVIAGRYLLVSRNQITFRVAPYDRRRPLIIDPVLHMPLGGGSVRGSPSLRYATYVGGSDLDDGLGLAVDAAGDAYLVGQTGSTDFPVQGAPQPRYGGAGDAFVTKLNPSGTALVYSTYLGGRGYEMGTAIAVDTSGHAYVTGLTLSQDFPPRRPLQAANGGGYDAFVTKLNAAGDAPIYSTYLGGRGNDGGFGIAVDAAGAAYVTGATRSFDFPTRHAVQAANHAAAGNSNAFIAKINSTGTALVYSTYLGGSGGNDGNGITVDGAGNAYLVGDTVRTTGFPLKNALQTSFGGGLNDATVAKLNAAGRYLRLGPDELHRLGQRGSSSVYAWGQLRCLRRQDQCQDIGGQVSRRFLILYAGTDRAALGNS